MPLKLKNKKHKYLTKINEDKNKKKRVFKQLYKLIVDYDYEMLKIH